MTVSDLDAFKMRSGMQTVGWFTSTQSIFMTWCIPIDEGGPLLAWFNKGNGMKRPIYRSRDIPMTLMTKPVINVHSPTFQEDPLLEGLGLFRSLSTHNAYIPDGILFVGDWLQFDLFRDSSNHANNSKCS